jgi:hypothetical protein
MPYAVYKLIHFLGIFTLIVVLAATSMHVLRGGTRADNPYRKVLSITHGVALFLVLLGGFGLLARIGVMHGGLPGWVYAKLLLWLTLGAALTLANRGARYARVLLLLLPLLAVLGGAIALYKPF